MGFSTRSNECRACCDIHGVCCCPSVRVCLSACVHVQRVASLEASKGELEGQLSGLAGLVAQLEARLREVTAQSQAASTAAELAAATAAQAQAAVGEQVAARLAAAGHNRSLWPPAAQQEVAELEQQLEFMQVCFWISYSGCICVCMGRPQWLTSRTGHVAVSAVTCRRGGSHLRLPGLTPPSFCPLLPHARTHACRQL